MALSIFCFLLSLSKYEAAAILLKMLSKRLQDWGLRVFSHHYVLVMFLAIYDAISLSVVVEIQGHLALRTLKALFVEFNSTRFYFLLGVHTLLADAAFVTTTEFWRHFLKLKRKTTRNFGVGLRARTLLPHKRSSMTGLLAN